MSSFRSAVFAVLWASVGEGATHLTFGQPEVVTYALDGSRSSVVRSEAFTFRAKQGVRVVVEVRATDHFVPRVTLKRHGEVLASSKRMGKDRASWLDASLPETSEYELVVTSGDGGPLASFTLLLQDDADLPTSRRGSFYLAHADPTHAWLADLSTLQRSGNVARFAFTEITSEPFALAGQKVHSIRYDYELDCVEDTFRRPKATARLLGPGGKHVLQDTRVTEKAASWAPLEQHGRLKELVCEPDGALRHLHWTQLEEAADAYRLALRLHRDEGEEELNPRPSPLGAAGKAAPTIALGQSLGATLDRDSAAEGQAHTYRLPLRGGQRFEVNAVGDFRPYLRLRSGDKVLTSTFGALSWGEAGPIGEDVELAGDTELLIEVRSLDAAGGRYTLNARPLPSLERAPGPLRIKVVDLDRALAQTGAGKAAAARMASWQKKRQQELDVDQARLREDAATLDKQRAVFSPRALAIKQAELDQRVNDLRALFQRLEHERVDLEQKEREAVEARLQAAIEVIASRDDLDLVLFREGGPVWFRTGDDLTDEVVRVTDANEKVQP